MKKSNSKHDIEQAEKEFKEITGACYLFLTSNGLKPEAVEDLLLTTVKTTIENIRATQEGNQ